MSDCTPIFLFGMDRSGTTLLAMMVGAHPEIAVPLATTGMWYEFADRLGNYHNLRTSGDLQRIVNDVAEHERIRLWRTELDLARIVSDVHEGGIESVVAAFHKEYARQKQKRCWANSDIATLDQMHRAYHWFPNARFVHIIRDGRDVALSNQTTPYGRGNIYECAEKWTASLRTNLRMGAILGSDHYHVVRYEKLILDAEQTLTQLCGFIGVPFSREMLNYGASVDERVPQEKQWLWPALKLPPQASKVERWRHEMTVTQRIVFERIAGPLLKELDYPVYEHIPRRLSALFLELLYLLDRGGRSQRFLRKMGYHRESLLERMRRARPD
ncbi:sulfotransferase [Thiohalocapsa sp. ML1]|jgi:hypothetical protein|uniref:sulfotransferase family protein n=1 Tax=Thiohalocapsa sp. ML1 TaxID=1431688 RepID=UPI0009EB71EE|nr:sulfotransferase [Thiohalocapsa sp. ML1]